MSGRVINVIISEVEQCTNARFARIEEQYQKQDSGQDSIQKEFLLMAL